jgi:glycosyltransferase involved in cell wall biosynthesis
MVEAPEVLLAVSGWELRSLCYRFPGIENPLTRSRYPLGRLLSGAFDWTFFRALKRADVVFAAADDRAIASLGPRSRGVLNVDRVRRLPTTVDSSDFFPIPMSDARREIGWRGRSQVLLFCGRLNNVKGWRLVLDAYKCMIDRGFVGELWIVGDGEDQPKVQNRIQELGLMNTVTMWGSQPCSELVKYYNAADVIVVSSYYEGWSQSMLEALCCGRPIVSTDVSGARDLIREGKNGYVLAGRDPNCFAEAIEATLALQNSKEHSLEIAACYDVKRLRARLLGEWNSVREALAVKEDGY